MLRKRYFVLVLLVCSLVLFSCDLINDTDSGYSFYLTEVSTSGSIGGLSVDYIELYNPTDEDIDLTGYFFGDSEGVTEGYEVTSTLNINEWDSVDSEWTSTNTSNDTYVIPANNYLIILYSNDFAITDAISETHLVTWVDEDSETQSVDAGFDDLEYLTVPEGLKGSKSEGVYIYDSEGSQMTNSFTYTADDQGDGTVFLYLDNEWTQGIPSPGVANE